MNNNYENEIFQYSYPFTWDKRNINYLKKVYDKKKIKEFIVPIVFRLRFYDINNSIVSDNTYSPSNNSIEFPILDNILIGDREYTFYGWEFLYNGELVTITSEDYTALKLAVMDGYDDIKLTAKYEVLK